MYRPAASRHRIGEEPLGKRPRDDVPARSLQPQGIRRLAQIRDSKAPHFVSHFEVHALVPAPDLEAHLGDRGALDEVGIAPLLQIRDDLFAWPERVIEAAEHGEVQPIRVASQHVTQANEFGLADAPAAPADTDPPGGMHIRKATDDVEKPPGSLWVGAPIDVDREVVVRVVDRVEQPAELSRVVVNVEVVGDLHASSQPWLTGICQAGDLRTRRGCFRCPATSPIGRIARPVTFVV